LENWGEGRANIRGKGERRIQEPRYFNPRGGTRRPGAKKGGDRVERNCNCCVRVEGKQNGEWAYRGETTIRHGILSIGFPERQRWGWEGKAANARKGCP